MSRTFIRAFPPTTWLLAFGLASCGSERSADKAPVPAEIAPLLAEANALGAIPQEQYTYRYGWDRACTLNVESRFSGSVAERFPLPLKNSRPERFAYAGALGHALALPPVAGKMPVVFRAHDLATLSRMEVLLANIASACPA